MQLTFAICPSALARWQTARAIRLLQAAHPGLECIQHEISTDGRGLRKRELEEALLSGRVQVAVHSLKDLPVDGSPGIVVAAIPERESAQDVLVSPGGWTLSTLPEGARVGTSSLRRAAQLLTHRPDLTVLPIRGNIDSRLQQVTGGEYDAIVLAQAGLTRLGLQAHIAEVFPLDVMLPEPGQGALAVQCRASDAETLELLTAIDDPSAAAAVCAERAFLSAIGGCSLPVAAYAEIDHGMIILTGAVLSPDGKQSIRLSAVDTDPPALGERLANFVLERGAAELLSASV